MGESLADMEARALRMGAVAFLPFSRRQIDEAIRTRPNEPVSDSIVIFPGVRRIREEHAPVVYEDPRWADLHRPD